MWCVAPLLLAIAIAQPGGPVPPGPEAAREPSTRIWYFHNSGWAVETRRHLLVFDFIDAAGYDTLTNLATRLLQSAEQDHRRVVVFVSHQHDDHYSRVIHRWRKVAPEILYVFGWNVGQKANRLLLAARADTTVDSLHIRTVASTDLGVGFLVSVDGLTLFHAGDHAEWSESESAAYRREIDWLAGFRERVDLAFLPIATGYACAPREDIRVGATYALTRLWPAVTFPMHVRCIDKLELYRAFAETVGAFAVRGMIQYPQRLGEGFQYDPLERRATRLPEPSTEAAVER